MKTTFFLFLAGMVLLAACSPSAPVMTNPEVSTTMPDSAVVVGTSMAFQTVEPSKTRVSSLPGGITPTELKYRLLAEFSNFFFCDPDMYPVAHNDAPLAIQRFPELQANAEEFQAILAHNGLTGLTSFTDEQKLLIYREHKKLAAISLELTGDRYLFKLQTDEGIGKGFRVSGWIDGQGTVTVQDKTPSVPSCPRCLALHTLIATPRGPVAVEALRAGDFVWTVNAAGERVAAVVLVAVRLPVPAGHEVVHIKLEDGRELWVSPGHPTADGRTIGNLTVGASLDGSRVVLAERVPYGQAATYDLLPSGATGFYWANGILMGSTLK